MKNRVVDRNRARKQLYLYEMACDQRMNDKLVIDVYDTRLGSRALYFLVNSLAILRIAPSRALAIRALKSGV